MSGLAAHALEQVEDPGQAAEVDRIEIDIAGEARRNRLQIFELGHARIVANICSPVKLS